MGLVGRCVGANWRTWSKPLTVSEMFESVMFTTVRPSNLSRLRLGSDSGWVLDYNEEDVMDPGIHA